MIERSKQGTAIFLHPEPVKANGVEPLENVQIFPVLRSATMLSHKSLNLLKACDNPLLAGRSPGLPLRLYFYTELGK